MLSIPWRGDQHPGGKGCSLRSNPSTQPSIDPKAQVQGKHPKNPFGFHHCISRQGSEETNQSGEEQGIISIQSYLAHLFYAHIHQSVSFARPDTHSVIGVITLRPSQKGEDDEITAYSKTQPKIPGFPRRVLQETGHITHKPSHRRPCQSQSHQEQAPREPAGGKPQGQTAQETKTHHPGSQKPGKGATGFPG